jgi:hypothetical protein
MQMHVSEGARVRGPNSVRRLNWRDRPNVRPAKPKAKQPDCPAKSQSVIYARTLID